MSNNYISSSSFYSPPARGYLASNLNNIWYDESDCLNQISSFNDNQDNNSHSFEEIHSASPISAINKSSDTDIQNTETWSVNRRIPSCLCANHISYTEPLRPTTSFFNQAVVEHLQKIGAQGWGISGPIRESTDTSQSDFQDIPMSSFNQQNSSQQVSSQQVSSQQVSSQQVSSQQVSSQQNSLQQNSSQQSSTIINHKSLNSKQVILQTKSNHIVNCETLYHSFFHPQFGNIPVLPIQSYLFCSNNIYLSEPILQSDLILYKDIDPVDNYKLYLLRRKLRSTSGQFLCWCPNCTCNSVSFTKLSEQSKKSRLGLLLSYFVTPTKLTFYCSICKRFLGEEDNNYYILVKDSGL